MKLKAIATCAALGLTLCVNTMNATVPMDLQSVGNEPGDFKSPTQSIRITNPNELLRLIRVLLSIDFVQTFLAQTITLVLFQIGFCGVSELHFHTPAIDRMNAFKGFSATGTGLGHEL